MKKSYFILAYLISTTVTFALWENVGVKSYGYGWEQVQIQFVYSYGEGNWMYIWEGDLWCYRPQPMDSSPGGFSLVSAGTFLMGSPEDEPGRLEDEIASGVGLAEPEHWVQITRDYYMEQFEVTKERWDQVRQWALANGYADIAEGQNGSVVDTNENHPVMGIDWGDAVKWCNARSEMEGKTPVYYSSEEFGEENIVRKEDTYSFINGSTYADWDANGYRLPTEAEWEYACRAGTATAFYTGPITYPDNTDQIDPNLDKAGWYAGNSGIETHLGGLKEPNAWDLYDMHGNVSEWCWDYIGDYPVGTETNPAINPRKSTRATSMDFTARILRGGSYRNWANVCRSAARRGFSSGIPASRYAGFRTVMVAEGWSKVVARNYNDGWQRVEINWAYNNGNNWIYLPEGSTWIYVLSGY